MHTRIVLVLEHPVGAQHAALRIRTGRPEGRVDDLGDREREVWNKSARLVKLKRTVLLFAVVLFVLETLEIDLVVCRQPPQ